MATLKSTQKKYPEQYADGKTWFAVENPIVTEILGRQGNYAFEEYQRTVFLTNAQHKYLDKRCTWAWFKCRLPANVCVSIIKECLSAEVEHFALCTHDLDKGTKPHTHVLIKFYRNESFTTKVFEYFHCDNIEDCRNKVGNCFAYLTHDSDQCRKDGKYQYPKQCLLFGDNDDQQFFENYVPTDINVAEQIVTAITNGMSEWELVHTFGREYCIYRNSYRTCAHTVMAQKEDAEKGLEVHYIQDGILCVYDKKTGNLVHIARTLDEVRYKAGLSV